MANWFEDLLIELRYKIIKRFMVGGGFQYAIFGKKDYPAFRDWALKNGYDPKLSLDRIDNDGNYSPENCRWVNYKTQHLNRAFKRDERGIFVKV